MAYKRQNFESSYNTGVFNTDEFAELNETNPIEKIFYEMRPVLFMIIALVALKHNVDGNMLGKMSSMILLAISAFILYSRMTARGHLK